MKKNESTMTHIFLKDVSDDIINLEVSSIDELLLYISNSIRKKIEDIIIFCEENDWLCQPDLVEESEYERMMNENPQKVKEYYEEWKRRKEKQKEKQKEDQTILF